MKNRLFAVLAILSLMLTISVGASAAQSDLSPAGADIEAGLVAADYAAVGSDPETIDTLPSAYSSLELGYVTGVRTQRYNTCWAYSSTAVTEVLLNKLGLGVGHLSPMEMNFRSVTHADGTGWQRGYSSAGYPYIALGCLTSTGVVKEETVPESITEADYAAIKDSLVPYAYAGAVIYLSGNSIDAVKTAVYSYGAAVGNFHYDTSMMNESTAAYYCDTESIPTANLFGHAVAIIGWDDDYAVENFNESHRPESKGAWLCKNSWGEWWSSMNGYFWISYEDHYLFESRFGPSYAISELMLNSDDVMLKQNELCGATYEFNYPQKADSQIRTLTYANVLDFSDGYRVIDKVTFESTAQGSEYEIYYIPTDEAGIPYDDESKWVLLYTGVIGYEGYHCADVKDYYVPDDAGAIGIKISRKDASGSISIGVGEWLSAGQRDIFIPESVSGQSYLLNFRDGAYDLMDFYRNEMQDEIGGTFVIKALTNGRILGDADGDGEVTILDATHIQRHLAGISLFNDLQEAVADDDRDGEVTILDATSIQRMLAGLD